MNTRFINLNSQLVYAPDCIWIIVPTEYDNNSSQIARAKRLSTVKQSEYPRILSGCLFFDTHSITCC